MRGGRNKFGPMYKRDRARKLQMMRQRQMAVQTLRNSGYAGVTGLSDSVALYQGGTNFQLHIKQEIQIPQVSSLTSSPDSSPSPITVALGHATMCPVLPTTAANPTQSQTGTSPAVLQLAGLEQRIGGAGGGGTTPQATHPQVFNNDKLWPSASPPPVKNFQYEGSSQSSGTTPTQDIKVSPMIRDFVQAIDDPEWQNSLFSLLQNQTYNQCEVDLFELMCKVLDQNLFSQVDWARNSIFFKDLKVIHFQFFFFFFFFYYICQGRK
ncbi:hypothetical protein O3M35_002916 [Rhynocoris fuscipes]|uniref:Nuclear hormone receptor FTZ-F1 n=1 Tax=Rhynocoris fuscipes TaxID=488301 RepID=A0AAW1CND4_9HEMI